MDNTIIIGIVVVLAVIIICAYFLVEKKRRVYTKAVEFVEDINGDRRDF